jgi:Rha family phage regulatory protein
LIVGFFILQKGDYMKAIEKTITSLEVAEMVEKDHSKLLKDIRRYTEQLGEAKIGFTDFFSESTYRTSQNKELPCYLVTKKGCEFIANKLTGVKGAIFTAKYINRFHEMEEVVSKPMSAMEQIKLLAQGNVELEQKIESVNKDLQDFKQDLPLLAVECERITKAVKTRGVSVLGGRDSEAYNDNSLRSKVYSDIHGEVRRQFGVNTYKAIKRSECEKVIEVINNYQPPMVIAQEIKDANAQIRF